MKTKTEQHLRQVLKQFQKEMFFSEVLNYFSSWASREKLTSEIRRLKCKVNQLSVVDVFVDLLKDSQITDSEAEDKILLLMLLGVAANASRRMWLTYTLKGDPPSEKFGAELESDMKHTFLQNKFHVTLTVHYFEGMQWIQIIQKRIVKNKLRVATPLYVARFIGEPYIFLNKGGSSHELLQSVTEGFGYTEYKFSNLSGRDLPSMLKHLNQKGIKRGEIGAIPSCYGFRETPNGIDFSQHIDRRKMISNLMGPSPPKLSNYVVLAKNLKWKGKKAPLSLWDKTFDMKIEFRTDDTVEMLKDMAECGVLKMPPPSYVRNLLSTGRNNIKLRAQGTGGATDTETQTDA